MSDATRKPVPPLTCKTDGGKLYTRFADVEAEIGAVWALPAPDWIARKKDLKSETLVFLVRKGGFKEDHVRGSLQAELNLRTIRIATGTIKGADYVRTEEMALEVESQIFNLIWSDANCAQAEYLEINFAGKVRDLTKNVIKRYKNSVMAKRDQLDEWAGAEANEENDLIEFDRDLEDTRFNAEEILLLIEDDSRLDELLQFIRDSVANPKDFLALYLFHAEEQSLAAIAAHFKTGIRQIRDSKDRAMHQIRLALGLESGEKREAMRKLRNARRARRRAEFRKSRTGSQPPSISL